VFWFIMDFSFLVSKSIFFNFNTTLKCQFYYYWMFFWYMYFVWEFTCFIVFSQTDL
jgi:hypothetical protein